MSTPNDRWIERCVARPNSDSRRQPTAWRSWGSARTVRRRSPRSRDGQVSMRRPRSEVRPVTDPETRWRGQQDGESVQPRRVLRALLRETSERVVHRPDREAMVLHVVEYILELVALDHRLSLR